jgi:environmental stress-induced protein Ves
MGVRARSDLGIVRPADVEPQPWANGLGVTRILAARPDWRISLADIEGRMPFSPFLGAERLLIPLSRSGVTLRIKGEEHRVRRHCGIVFRGEDEVIAETDGRIEVVNIMTRRSTGELRWEIGDVSGHVEGRSADAVIVLHGHITAASETLPPGTVLGPAALRAEGGSVVAMPGGRVARVWIDPVSRSLPVGE